MDGSMFPNLKLQIFRCGTHQNHLAKAVGIDETVLSKIICGYRTPTATQRKILASYLGADEAWLFAIASDGMAGNGARGAEKEAR